MRAFLRKCVYVCVRRRPREGHTAQTGPYVSPPGAHQRRRHRAGCWTPAPSYSWCLLGHALAGVRAAAPAARRGSLGGGEEPGGGSDSGAASHSLGLMQESKAGPALRFQEDPRAAAIRTERSCFPFLFSTTFLSPAGLACPVVLLNCLPAWVGPLEPHTTNLTLRPPNQDHSACQCSRLGGNFLFPNRGFIFVPCLFRGSAAERETCKRGGLALAGSSGKGCLEKVEPLKKQQQKSGPLNAFFTFFFVGRCCGGGGHRTPPPRISRSLLAKFCGRGRPLP